MTQTATFHAPLTLFDTLWQRHLLLQTEDGECRLNVDPCRKPLLLEALDDIGLTLQRADRIRAFGVRHRAASPSFFSVIHPIIF